MYKMPAASSRWPLCIIQATRNRARRERKNGLRAENSPTFFAKRSFFHFIFHLTLRRSEIFVDSMKRQLFFSQVVLSAAVSVLM